LQYIKDQAERCTPQFAWDGTYKLNGLRYPLIVTTTQDSMHTIFPTSFTIASNESEATYSFILKALRNSYKKIYKTNFIFKYIMSDGADYILMLQRNIWKEIKHI